MMLNISNTAYFPTMDCRAFSWVKTIEHQRVLFAIPLSILGFISSMNKINIEGVTQSAMSQLN